MPIPKDLLEKQNKSLWLANRPPLKNLAEAKKFMASVGICLRYWATKGIPIASAYQAGTGALKKEVGHRNAIELTNGLLAEYNVIEVNVIAGRLSLVHASLMPALYRLVTRGKKSFPLSTSAIKAYRLIEENGHIAAGDLRKLLGIPSGLQEDPAYQALAELQRYLIADRGPFKMPKKGIPYLPKEGYPYHFFREAHFDLLTKSEKLSLSQAADSFVLGYLKGALFCSLKKMAAMFKLFLSPEEIGEAADRLRSRKKITLEIMGRDLVARIA